MASAEPLAQLFERPVQAARDARLNRVIDASPSTGPGGFGGAAVAGASATAIGNVLAVTQNGSGNTLVLSVRQRNDGAISAGTALNGSLSVD